MWGLERYGFKDDAARIAGKFLRTLATDFERTGWVFEVLEMIRPFFGITGYKPIPNQSKIHSP